MATKRVTYRKVPKEHDYVDARFDVLLDGEVVGQVTRDRRTKRHGYAHSMLGYDTTATAWVCEGTSIANGHEYRYESYGTDYATRIDAVIDYLVRRGMNYHEARAATGKRGL